MKKIVTKKSSAKDKRQLEDIKHPVFCFRYLHKNFHVDKCEDDEKIQLLKRIVKLCSMTWQEIEYSDRHAFGSEKINLNAINLDLPDEIAGKVPFYLALRFDGKKPFVGFRDRFVFHVLYIDPKFNLYKH